MASDERAVGLGRVLGRMWAKRWVRWVVYVWVAVFIGGKLMPVNPPAASVPIAAAPTRALSASGSPKAEPAINCPVGTPSGRTVRLVASPTELMSQPSSKADRLPNEVATKSVGRPQYFAVERSDLLFEDCLSGEWSHVKLLQPDHRGSLQGWLPNSKLRERQMVSGAEVFTQENIEWGKATRPYRELIVAGVNKIHRTNPRCKQLELSSVELSTSKGTKADPVFYVTCRHDGLPFNAFFSKSDVEKDVSLNGAHMDRTIAVNKCEAAAKARAQNPSTVDFSKVMNISVVDFPNGRTKVQSKFTAQNAFGAMGKYRIECMFERGAVIEVNIHED